MEFRDWLNGDSLFSEDTEDKSLLNAAREGDQFALGVLLSKWQKRIFTAIVRKVQSNEDAQDITQEVMANIVQAVEVAPPENFSKWIWAVIRNAIASYYRKRKDPTVARPEETILTMSPYKMGRTGIPIPGKKEKEDPTNIASGYEEKMLVHQALRQMEEKGGYSKRAAELLRKKYFDEMKASEIAEEQDMPLGTVKRAIHQAKKELGRYLKRGGIED